jgi:hypothetical protein
MARCAVTSRPCCLCVPAGRMRCGATAGAHDEFAIAATNVNKLQSRYQLVDGFPQEVVEVSLTMYVGFTRGCSCRCAWVWSLGSKRLCMGSVGE